MTVKEAKKKIDEMLFNHYEAFATALIQIEYRLNEENAKRLYQKFYNNDDLQKITQIDQATELYQEAQGRRETNAIADFILDDKLYNQ